MPMWISVHGVLLVVWGSIWLGLYYSRLWTLSTPFNKATSIKITFYHLFPLTWLISSILVGLILYLVNILKMVDIILLVLIPSVILLIYFINLWFSNFAFRKREDLIQKNLNSFKNNCENWIKQFTFLSKDKYELQVFISKDKPVGRLIFCELTLREEHALKKNKEQLPSDVTLLFLNKKCSK